MKKVLLICFLFSIYLSYAQQFSLEQNDTLTKDKIEISFQSVIESASTSLPNSFVNKFMFGGEISSDLINQTSLKQNNVNRYGLDFSSQIELNLFNFILISYNLIKYLCLNL